MTLRRYFVLCRLLQFTLNEEGKRTSNSSVANRAMQYGTRCNPVPTRAELSSVLTHARTFPQLESE